MASVAWEGDVDCNKRIYGLVEDFPEERLAMGSADLRSPGDRVRLGLLGMGSKWYCYQVHSGTLFT